MNCLEEMNFDWDYSPNFESDYVSTSKLSLPFSERIPAHLTTALLYILLRMLPRLQKFDERLEYSTNSFYTTVDAKLTESLCNMKILHFYAAF